MLSYQHGYHAGNYADVIKHLVLSRLISYMVGKEKPLLYLETHAGRGQYDLHGHLSGKTGEALQGIRLLWDKRQHLPEVFLPYVNALTTLNPGKTLRYYPGSPWLAVNMLRAQDRLVCAELHPQEFNYLKRLPHAGKRVLFKQANGLDELKALLPPIERRALIFIDPSYEIKTDYRLIPELVKDAYRRFETGVYCIWYPIVDQKHHDRIKRGLKLCGGDGLQVEFYQGSGVSTGMKGCGLWIINPPYVLAAELKIALDALCQIINPSKSFYTLCDTMSVLR